jgi:alkanesulfonate monooxygenase SsuD/methylene tetrahydromethanopterin reductase-like flavin-dependent oxidoreductase (luciferase family)
MSVPQLVLSVALNGAGHHPGAWRAPHARRAQALGGARYRDMAQLAERGGLDFALLGYPARGSALASPGGAEAIRLDALSLAAALIPVTTSIGLVASAPATYWEPFNIARAFSGLDNLSRGRAGWCVDAAWRPDDVGNFKRLADIDPAMLGERTREFLQVAFALWDSWEAGALVFDVANARFTDHTRVHRIDHAGAFFKVEGPLNSPRPPQGRPLIVQTDTTMAGLDLAAATADVLIIRPLTMIDAIAMTTAAKARAAAIGRSLVVLADLMPVLDAAGADAVTRLTALEALAPPSSPDQPEPLSFTGAAADLAEMLRQWAEAGACDGFNLLPATYPDDLAAFVEDVVPELRRRGVVSADDAGATLRDRLRLPQPISRHAAPAHG